MPTNYLKLAENGQRESAPVYFFVPSTNGEGGIFIREDSLDSLPGQQWDAFMNEIAPYQQENYLGENFLNENYLSSKADREARRDARLEKTKAKTEGIKSGTYESGASKLIGGLTKVASGIFGGGQQPAPVQTAGFNAADILAGINKATAPSVTPPPEKPFYKNPVVIGLGLLAAAGIVFYGGKQIKKRKVRRGGRI